MVLCGTFFVVLFSTRMSKLRTWIYSPNTGCITFKSPPTVLYSNKMPFIPRIMLILDETLLSSQPLLSGHSPVPRGGIDCKCRKCSLNLWHKNLINSKLNDRKHLLEGLSYCNNISKPKFKFSQCLSFCALSVVTIL